MKLKQLACQDKIGIRVPLCIDCDHGKPDLALMAFSKWGDNSLSTQTVTRRYHWRLFIYWLGLK